MSCVVRHWVSQEWPWIAPDNIAAAWQCFTCKCAPIPWDKLLTFVENKWSSTKGEARNDDRAVKKRKEQKYTKRRRCRREAGDGNRRREGRKENNSQLLRWRMPRLQIDQSINSLIIYSLLIVSWENLACTPIDLHSILPHILHKHVYVLVCAHVC